MAGAASSSEVRRAPDFATCSALSALGETYVTEMKLELPSWLVLRPASSALVDSPVSLEISASTLSLFRPAVKFAMYCPFAPAVIAWAAGTVTVTVPA